LDASFFDRSAPNGVKESITMNPETKTNADEAPKANSEELSLPELEQISGAGIKGESTEDNHKDWIE
jgi:hypothetical protein